MSPILRKNKKHQNFPSYLLFAIASAIMLSMEVNSHDFFEDFETNSNTAKLYARTICQRIECEFLYN